MRKRTQLVGFEFGYNKHTQYSAEFLDNALDAIESFQWKEIKKDSNIKFSLDQELSLENLIKREKEIENIETQPINDEAKHTLMQEFGIEPIESDEIEIEVIEKEEEKAVEILKKDEVEVEEEVKNIINDMEDLILLVEDIIDVEPIVMIRLREYEAATFLTSELSQKNVMSYTFEIFDNGTGMGKPDLRKFGKYLASSKSIELKQTRGSQGFGAPSAFSDSQNTTGRPIVAVSKSAKNLFATVSEFFITSKNEKKYLIAPTDIDAPFLHGTYIKLNYLNVKYVRGYVDTYIKETALMNPHITLIYIDPHNEEFIFPRKVSSFPEEPKYAKPHPSSTNIGDLQDLIIKSENRTISAFLQENFVRVSGKTANQILQIAERELQDKLKLLILKNGFLNITEKKTDKIYFLRFEKRVYGRSKKATEKLMPYLIVSDEIITKYWDSINSYNQFNKNIEKIRKEIKKHKNRIDKAVTKKEITVIEKEIKKLIKDIDNIRKEKDKIKVKLDGIFKDVGVGFTKEKDKKIITDLEDAIKDVQITKTKPMDLTSDQFNSLFQAFKSIKYMAPPTDTAIPVGDTVLENTLIKELGLKISENLDDFDSPREEIYTTSDVLIQLKKNSIIKEDPSVDEEILNSIRVDNEEIIDLSTQILAQFDFNGENIQADQLNNAVNNVLNYSDAEPKDTYKAVYEYFIENFTKDDDFVSAETRPPTSGKGLAYAVEAVLAYSRSLEVPKRSHYVLSRFVNRTPKLRDTADCAITKAVQSVNWKNYKLETYDNGLPKGPIKLLVNISGPFVHLMFKSQSKNSLADDEDLLKEIKACLEAIGRRVRIYINRRLLLKKTEKRSSLIERFIPQFVKSIYNIASQGKSIYKAKINEKELITLMKDAIGVKKPPALKPEVIPPEISEVEAKKEKPKKEEIDIDSIKTWTVKKLRDYCQENKIEIPVEISKVNIIKKIEEALSKEKLEEKPIIKEEVVKPEEKPPEKKTVIEKALPKKEVFSIKTLNNWTIKELRDYCKEHNVSLTSKARKPDIINKIQDYYAKPPEVITPKVPVKAQPVTPGTLSVKRQQLKIAQGKAPSSVKAPIKPKVAPPPPKTTQTKLPLITTNNIFSALTKEWQNIQHLIFKLKIKDMMDARYLQIKLKNLERSGDILVDIKKGKRHWRLK